VLKVSEARSRVCGCWGMGTNSAGVSRTQQNLRAQSRKCSVGVVTPVCPDGCVASSQNTRCVDNGGVEWPTQQLLSSGL
jgi:hypothetical protein